MKKAMKFLIPVLGNAALVFADGNGDCCPKPVQKCETKCKEVCDPCPTKKVCKTTCCTVRPKPPCECVTRTADCGVDFFVTADFIWWKAREDGLEFALTNTTAAAAAPAQGAVNRERTKYRPGFKVGLGLDFNDWGWDTYFNYTWFRSNHSNSSSATTSVVAGAGQSALDAYWFANTAAGGATPAYTAASETWRLRMNVLDWEMGRKYWIGKHIALRPHVGLKGAWNTQDLGVSFSGGDAAVGTVVTSNNSEKFRGVGVRGGMDAAFHFSRGFSILGKFALTGMYEKFRVSRSDNTVDAAGVVTSAVNVRDNFWNVEPVLEWFLGFNWETWWSCDNMHFALWAGWEQQFWGDQARFVRMPGSAQHGAGDLAFEGLTVGAKFEF
jgi:hypothetical protein